MRYKSTVFRLVTLFPETGNASDRRRFGPRTVINDLSVENIRNSLMQPPRRSFFFNLGSLIFDHPVHIRKQTQSSITQHSFIKIHTQAHKYIISAMSSYGLNMAYHSRNM